MRMLRATDVTMPGIPIAVVRPSDYKVAHSKRWRSARPDAGRDPMSITPAAVRGITGRNRDDVEEALESVVEDDYARGTWGSSCHGVDIQWELTLRKGDIIPQTMDKQTVLSLRGQGPGRAGEEVVFSGTPDEVHRS